MRVCNFKTISLNVKTFLNLCNNMLFKETTVQFALDRSIIFQDWKLIILFDKNHLKNRDTYIKYISHIYFYFQNVSSIITYYVKLWFKYCIIRKISTTFFCKIKINICICKSVFIKLFIHCSIPQTFAIFLVI